MVLLSPLGVCLDRAIVDLPIAASQFLPFVGSDADYSGFISPDTRPTAPFDDISDRLGIYAVSTRCGSNSTRNSHRIGANCRPYLPNLIRGQFRGPSMGVLWMGRKVAASPSFRKAISHVVALRSEEQVRQLVAGGGVAVVADTHPGWNRAVGFYPR